ncbi:MAG: NADH-quinone oxidoreductase subunit L, partial [Cytophagaceae bacterium]
MKAQIISNIPFICPDSVTLLALVVLLLPLISFFFLFFFANKIPRKGDWLATGVMGLTFLLSLYLLFMVLSGEEHILRVPWFKLDLMQGERWFSASMLIDRVVALLVVIVTFVSLLVHLYSMDYMRGKRNYGRYFPYLGVFTSSMLGILMSDNLLVTFFCWELVGFSSYLLIGFWFDKESAIKASKKAFLFNRIGDTGFLLAILAIFAAFGTFELSIIKDHILHEGIDISGIYFTLAGLGIFMGCVGKSAQFPLQVWLPHAMEGPTPVSALIHAATMVAAGIYLLAKTFVLLNMDVLTIIAFIGAITAVVGALPALVQNDIKKVLAYSTISQLGYMVMAMGVQAYEASLFHLITHAFFKACLFLSAGAVIHAMHEIKHHMFDQRNYNDFDAQDMRLMGGFYKRIPLVFSAYLISALSLIGIPLFSGFLSKDAILEATWNWAAQQDSSFLYIIPVMAFFTVFVTAFYMIRQMLMVFFGDFKLGHIYPEAQNAFNEEGHVSPLMKAPLLLLSFLSLGFVFSLNPFSNTTTWLLNWLKAPYATIQSTTVAGLHDIVPVWVMI